MTAAWDSLATRANLALSNPGLRAWAAAEFLDPQYDAACV